MPHVDPERVFDFYPLEDRILLSGEGLDGADVAPDAEIVASLMAELAEAEGEYSGDTFGVGFGEPSADGANPDEMDAADLPTYDHDIPLEVIFLDSHVDDADTLLSGLRDVSDDRTQWLVVELAADEDGVEQISQTLSQLSNVDAVHIVSHGDGQGIQIGDTRLDVNSAAGYAGELASWANSLDADADLLIYGCDLASTTEGRALIESIGALCDCDVAASDDATGHESLGADWDLEYSVGEIGTEVAFGLQTRSIWLSTLDTATGLVAHWDFDSDVLDDSGNGYDGVLSGDAASIDTASGTNMIGVGKLSVAGSDDYVDLSGDAAVFGAMTQGTISAWINTSDTINTQSIFGVADIGDPFSFATLGTYQGKLMFDVAENGYVFSVSTTAVIADGNWHHVAVTVDGAGNSLFIDGVKVPPGSLTYSPGNATSTRFLSSVNDVDAAHIGGVGESNSVTYDFDGLIDDVRVYDRALSTSDMSDLFAENYTGSTVTVTNTSDIANGNTLSIGTLMADDGGDGISLREAIEASNNSLGTDTIEFEITDALVGGAHTVSLTSSLPDITDTVIIDGTTDSDFSSTPIIVLNGSSAGTADGLTLADGSDGSTIRGLVINNFAGDGIQIETGADGITIAGNYIGTDVSGTLDEGNTDRGIRAESAGNVIGGLTSADRNVISGNDTDGIVFTQTAATNNLIIGNYIGTDATGTADLGNTQNGVRLNVGASGSVIGGNSAAERNIISGNNYAGIRFSGANATGISVQGNYIGTDASGTAALGNTQYGVIFDNAANNNLIGGVGAGDGNLIAHNDRGIRATSSTSIDNALLGNTITSNTGLGIDIGVGGLDSNDSEDSDTGANDSLNFPVLTNVVQSGSDLDIDFDVDLPAGQYRIEFFDNPSGLDGSEFGEGETFIGFANITVTGAAGYESFSTTLTGVTASDIKNVTTTATEANATFTTFSSTSEFGPQFAGAGVIEVTTTSETNDGDVSSIAALLGNRGADGEISLIEAMHAANNTTNIGGNPDQIHFDIDTTDLNYNAGTNSYLIQLTSVLPFIEDSVTIDATTQLGYAGTPSIDLDGSLIGGLSDNGFETDATGLTIRGFVVRNFTGVGIHLSGSDAHTIQSNYIGTDVTGTIVQGNGIGVYVGGGADTTIIGGVGAGQGNVISGNAAQGIYIDGAGANQIQGNYIGTDVTGTVDLGNVTHGIEVSGSAVGTIIGGITAAHRNVIAGNEGQGIEISGATTTGTVIQGNYIGTDSTGLTGLRNNGNGVRLSGNVGTTIGGTAAGAGNVISGNDNSVTSADGIYISGGSGHTVQGNYIGVGRDGATAIGNYSSGIAINSSTGNLIGGGVAGAANVISGNPSYGVSITGVGSTNNQVQGNIIGLAADGTTIVGGGGYGVYIASDANNNLVGTDADGSNDASERNIISGNNYGVFISGAGSTSNTVAGNYIGTDITGVLVRGNTSHGVYVASANNTIGGTNAVERNVIAGNTGSGIALSGASATGNLIQGNYVGTDAAGTADLGNGSVGVWITAGASSNVVGGTAAGARNVISGNGIDGIQIQSATSTLNTIIGNYIGTDFTGTLDLGNTQHGVRIVLADNNTIGGTAAGSRNVISGNNQAGVYISGASATGNKVHGNYIGTDATGMLDLGNASDGVVLHNGATDNTIGGNTAAQRNIISGNDNDGIWITGTNTADNVVQGNWIGLDAAQGSLGNSYHGIGVQNGAADNLIGGTGPGEGNTIAHNAWDGISTNGSGTGNTFVGNSIYDNGDLGIDIEAGVEDANGVTANDIGDVDSGANNLQNYPELKLAALSGTDLALSGTFNTDGLNTQYRIEFFGNPGGTQDATNGEGRVYLGATTLTTNASGSADFKNLVLSGVTLNGGDYVTATATRITDPVEVGNDDLLAYGSTSEFGPNVIASASNTAPTIAFGEGNQSYTENGARIAVDSSITVTDIDARDFNSGTLTVSFTSGGSPDDRLAVSNEGTGVGQVGLAGSDVTYNFGSGAVIVGTVSGGTSGSDPLVVTFNTNSDDASVQAVTRQIEFLTLGDDPSTATRTVQYQLTDGDGGTSTAITKDIAVTAVNDAPSFSVTNSTPTFNEDGGAVSLFSGTAVDLIEAVDLVDTFVITVDSLANGSNEILIVDGQNIELTDLNSETTASGGYDVDVSVSGTTATVTITKTGGFSTAEAESLVDGVGYNNTSDDPQGAARLVTLTSIKDDGGTANGGSDTAGIGVSSLVTIDAVNDAPVANIGPPGFGVNEDDGYRLLGGFSVSDVDAGGSDIAFTLSVGQGTINLTNTTGLTLTAGANGSATMTFTGSVSNINTALGAVAYKPDANFNGTDTITLSVDDQGNTGSGGPLSGSDNANIIVSARNDAPALNDGFIVGLPGADEDSTTAGTTVAAIVDNASWSDIDVGAVKGMAVTSVSGNGNWQYSTDGLTWNSFGAVSSTNALLLSATSQVRYAGDGANGEIPTFNFVAWDTTSGTASTNATPSFANPGSGGGTSAYSSESASAAATITSLNDAPALDNTGPMDLPNVLKNTTDPAGSLVSTIIDSAGGDRITDADTGSVEGIAVIAVDDTNGTWQYSIDGGSNWIAFGAVNSSSAVVLTDTTNDRIRFVPNTDYVGNASFDFRAWDMTDANSSGTTGVNPGSGGGTTAFSTATETVSIDVEPTEIFFWYSTTEDVGPTGGSGGGPASGTPGLANWSEGEVIGFGDPNMSFGLDTTDGTFVSITDFDAFAVDSDVDLAGLHYVGNDITISGPGITAGSIDLHEGDLIFATLDAESLSNAAAGAPAGWSNSIATTGGDVYVFRSEYSNDYTSGYFRQVMSDPSAGGLAGLTLVENDTVVGDTLLAAGDFLFSQSGTTDKNDISWYDASLDTAAKLIEGDDLGISRGIDGLQINGEGQLLGSVTIGTGTILVSLDQSDSIGTNNQSVSEHDVVELEVTSTTLGSGTAVANAEVVFDGDDVGLNHVRENIDALTLVVRGIGTNQGPSLGATGPVATYIENGAPVLIDSTITVIDADSADFASGLLRVDIASGADANDRLGIFHQGTGAGDIGVDHNTVTYEGTVIGTFSGGHGADPLVFTLNANADQISTRALMRNITFFSVSDSPGTALRTVEFTLTDGDGAGSNVISQSINVSETADAPVAVNDNVGLEFDGIDDYVTIADSANLTMTATMTMEAWINPDTSANVNRMIINKEGEYEVALFSDDRIYWAFANTDPGWAWHDTGYTVTNNQWSHIAVSYDNGTVSTYVNGTLVEVYNGSGVIGDSHATLDELRIGGRSNNPAGKFFDGEIDEVRIWNTARTQAEIAANLDVSLTGAESGLAGYWTLEEGAGGVTADLTTNANNGTLIDGGAGTAGPQWFGYSTNEDTSLVINAANGVISNDVDGDGDTLIVTQVNGSVANVGSLFTLASGANLTVGSGGNITYDPNGAFESLDSGQRATDTFTYQIDDGNGGSDVATVTIAVIGLNDAPTIATNVGMTVLEGSTGNGITGAMLGEGDPDDDGNELVYTITDVTDNGTMYLSGFGALGLNDTFSQADIDTAKLSYDHDDSETTSDAFSFSLADGGEDSATPATGTFSIAVTPVNDNSATAVSDSDATADSVFENATVGTNVGVTAASQDDDTGDTIAYSLDNNDGGRFAIDAVTGVVTVAGAIDREIDGASRSITIRATSSDTSFTTQVFVIAIGDVDEFDVAAPSDSNPTTNAVDENAATDTVVGVTALATDNDATNNIVSYSLDNNAGGRFKIDSASGVVTVDNGTLLDRESAASHSITVRATSIDGSFDTAVISINVNDVDEFDVSTPTDGDGATNEVDENVSGGTTVGITADAFDLDATNNSITYSLTSNPNGLFSIDTNTGVVITAAAIDRETHGSTRSITVEAVGSDGSVASQSFNITINDVDEFDVSVPADLDGTNNEVTENATIGSTVGVTADAFDLDATSNTITYSLTSNLDGLFAIDANTGVVTTAAAIDREFHGSTRSITVQAASSDGSVSNQSFDIDINDVDEFDVGVVSDNDLTVNAVDENAATDTAVGVTALASDADATNNTISYTLDDNAGGRFKIDAVTGEVTVDNGALLDRETAGSHNITVRATSSDGSSNTAVMTINVGDVDEFDVTVPTDSNGVVNEVDENVAVGTNVGITADAFDLDATNNTITYSLTSNPDNLFKIDTNTGVVTTDAAIDRETHGATRLITVRAASSDGSTQAQVFSITINDLNDFDISVPTDVDGANNEVDENVIVGTTTGITANAFDLDATNNTITYSLSSNPDGLFKIDANTGVVTTDAAIDRETHGATRSITVQAASSDGSTQTQTFNITINDLDDFDVSVPTDSDAAANEVDENVATDTTVGITADAFDLDATNNTITFSLTSNPDNLFKIDSNTGVVTTNDAIDRETHGATRSITIQAQSSDGSTQTRNFNITINDLVEFDVSVPTDSDATANEVDENAPTDTTVGITADAFDLDATNNTITYSLASNPDNLFKIDANTGLVTTDAAIDRETHGATRSITVQAASSDGSAQTQSFSITINDLDEFDVTVPVDSNATINQVAENAGVGTSVGITALAADADATNNSITYVLDDDASGRFTIDGSTGMIMVNAALDYESNSSHNVTVRATSADGSSNTKIFTINVTDANEFGATPIIDTNTAGDAVAENAVVGTTVGVTAFSNDADGTDTITYSLDDSDGGRFSIDPATGIVTVAGAIDREADGASRSITVRATSTDSSFQLRGFTITINDVDEFDVTAISDSDATINAVDENAANGTVVGVTALAADADATNNAINYSLDDDAGGRFAIDSVTGVVTVADGTLLDREAAASHAITVRAGSSDGSSNTQVITININDVDEFDVGPISDSNPASNAVDENAANGTVVGATALASDADATNNTVSYTLDDNAGGRFAIDGSTGVVTVADGTLLDREAAASHAITVRAASSDGSSNTQVLTINVNDIDESDVGAVSDGDTALNQITENSATGSTVGITALASDADATTNAISYSLPDDDGGRFTIDSSTGVVTVAGTIDRETDGATRNITVRATSADGSFSDQAFSININDVDEFDASATIDTNAAVNSVAENATVGTTVGITASATDLDATNNTIVYSLDDNDGGRFAIDSTTGVVTVAGAIDREADGQTRTITVRSTSSDGSSTTEAFTINISDVDEFDATATIDTDAASNQVDENAVVGTVVGITASATDGDATNNTVTYSLDNNDSGRFAIDSASGVVTVAGAIDREADGASRSITVRSTSADGSFSIQALAISINDVDEFGVTTPVDSDTSANLVNENSTSGTLVGVTALATDADAMDSVSYSLDDNAGGRFTIDGATGLVSVSGFLDFETSASHNITVRATSTDGSTTTQVVTINVGDINEAPVAADDDGYSGLAGTAITLDSPSPLDNDGDVDGDALVIQVVAPPTNGTLSIDALGNLVYTPNAAFIGTDTITYRVDDGSLSSNLAVISIDVIVGVSTGGSDPTPDPHPDPVSEPGPDGGDSNEEENETEEESSESEAEATPTVGRTQRSPETNAFKIKATSPSGDDGNAGATETIGSQADAVKEFFLLSQSRDAQMNLHRSLELEMFERLLQLDLEQAVVWQQWDQSRSEDEGSFSLYVGSAGIAAGLFSVGYVFWAIRGGAFLAAITSTLPSWRLIDPAALLGAYRASRSGSTDRIERMLG